MADFVCLGRMSRCDAPDTQEKQQPWEVKQEEMGWFGAWRVHGGVGYSGLSEGWVELELMIRDSFGKQVETDWTPEITILKGQASRKDLRGACQERRDLCGSGWGGEILRQGSQHLDQTWQRKAKKNEERSLL